jgi:hypothetical protein
MFRAIAASVFMMALRPCGRGGDTARSAHARAGRTGVRFGPWALMRCADSGGAHGKVRCGPKRRSVASQEIGRYMGSRPAPVRSVAHDPSRMGRVQSQQSRQYWFVREAPAVVHAVPSSSG